MSLDSAQLAALLAQPALAAPAGVTADFDNPPNRNGLAWFVTTFCMIIATLSLLIRGYAKLWVKKEIHVEEVLMLGAYVRHFCLFSGPSIGYTKRICLREPTVALPMPRIA